MMHWIVSYSGGAASWAAAQLTQERLMADGDDITLLFADTLIEDEDTYRFLHEGAAALGLEVTRIADGRSPFEVFRDVRFLGNSRVDPCSRILKREILDAWVTDAAAAGPVTQIVGLDWTEMHRFERMRDRMDVEVRAPLVEFKLDKSHVHGMVEAAGLKRQRLYDLGFEHANCGGGCIKAGQSAFAHLLRTMPDRFEMWEREEASLRQELGDVAILRDRSGGDTTPLPLSELRERIDLQPTLIPADDWGGCGCAID